MRVLPLFLAFAVFPLQAQPVEGSVRVRLLEQSTPTRATITAQQGALEVRAGQALLGILRPGESAEVQRGRDRVTVRFEGTDEAAQRIRFVPQAGAYFRLRTGRRDRTYHGALSVSPDPRRRNTVRLINTVSLHDYVASVVPSEYPFPEIEGVKAQAVLVRTYALKSRGKYGDYDLKDHVGSQVYRGIGSETPLARRATEITQGEVLTHRGALIEAVYSSSSGGHTADNDAIWDGSPLPYLRGRQDPYDRGAPDHQWATNVGRSELHRALSNHFDVRVTGLEIAKKSREGRARTIRLMGSGKVVQANALRLAVNRSFGSRLLRSTFFSVELRGDRYYFRGRGFGHGVGMSQYGARGQAQQGHGYRDILAFYFADTRLERRAVALGEPLYADTPRPTQPMTPIPGRPAAEPPVRPASSAATRARANRTGW